MDTRERKVALEHRYRSRTRQVVSMDIPAGYRVSYLPPAAKKSVDGLWGFSLQYQQSGNKVYLVKEFEHNSLYTDPSRFKDHNKLVEELRKHYKESIIFTAD